MNKVYRIVRNHTTGELVVASELACNKSTISKKLATVIVSIIGMASVNAMAQSCVVDNGQIKDVTTAETCSFLTVGQNSTGTLNIKGDGKMDATFTDLGENSGSKGIITITDNGILNSTFLTIGNKQNTEGTLNITGPNTQLNADHISVGYNSSTQTQSATGYLNISGGATVNTADLDIAGLSTADNSKGYVVLDNSTLNVSNDAINRIYVS